MPYSPKLVDTSDVFLSEDLKSIVEQLAKNIHENWASVRMSQGWRYGPERSDLLKEHPCLVPFENLLESEKEHDRRIVQEILKTLLILGFEIHKCKKMD